MKNKNKYDLRKLEFKTYVTPNGKRKYHIDIFLDGELITSLFTNDNSKKAIPDWLEDEYVRTR